MSTQMDNPVDAAHATVDAMSQQANPGDVAQVVRDEIKSAHDAFADKPQDYRDYINTLKGGVSQSNQPEWLHDVEIFDSAATANDTIDGKTAANGAPITRADDIAQVRALSGSADNKDELYRLLDNYSATKNSDTSDAARADGKIGRGDLQAFIEDAQSGQDNAAAQYLAKHPEVAPAILKMNDRLGDAPGFIVRDELLNEMGYQGADALTTFQNDNPALGAVVTMGANGKPDSLVIPDGTARGFHYNESGDIDAINKTNPDGSTKQYRRDEQGLWVDESGNPAGFAKPSFDENGNYSYYTPDANDPNKVLQTSIDSKTGMTSAAEVPATDAAGNSVLADPPAAELSASGAPVDIAVGAPGKIGALDVVGAEGGAEYQIASGDTLTAISRRILNLQPGQEDPANLTAVVHALADANKYDNPDLIFADTKMKVPGDILSAAAPAQPEQLSAEQQELSPEQQALSPEQQQALSPEQQELSPEQQALSPEQQALSPEQQTLSPEQQAVYPELGTAPQSLGPQAQALSPDQQAQGTQPQALYPDQQALGPQPQAVEPSVPAGQAQTWEDLVANPEIYGQSADSAPKV